MNQSNCFSQKRNVMLSIYYETNQPIRPAEMEENKWGERTTNTTLIRFTEIHDLLHLPFSKILCHVNIKY